MVEEEYAIIKQCLAGDAEQYAVMVDRYKTMAYNSAYRLLGDADTAKDMAQESFISAYGALGHFKFNAKFSSWLYRIAINVCLTWRQREARRDQVHTSWARANANAPGELDGPAESDPLSESVQAALMKLPPKQRAAIVLTVYDGHNHAEAARVLGCSETTVSWRVFAARRKLKRWLNTEGGPDA